MKKVTKACWIVWGILFSALTAAAVLLAPARSACFYTSCLASLLTFLLVAGVFRKASSVENAESALIGQPVAQVGIGVLVLQTAAGIAFILLAGVCHWLIAACVECILLCIAAAALTLKEEQPEQPGAEQGEDGRTE